MPGDYLKTIVRLRGPNTSDPSAKVGACFALDGNVLTLPSLPNSGIFKPDLAFKEGTSNDDVWAKFGKDLMGKFTDVGGKTHHLISVWGSEGTGKSYITRGITGPKDTESFHQESIVGRAVEELALQDDVMMSVWLFHQDSIMDLGSGSDHMKPKTEDGVVTVDNTSVCKVTSSAVVQEYIQKCFEKRQEFFTKTGSSEAMTNLVIQFVFNGSSLTIIEHASLSVAHVPLPSLTADQKKQLEEKNRVQAHAQKMWTDAATSADPKALGWKDTKLGRFLQPGLGGAMDNTSMAVLIVCAANVEARKYDSLIAAQFAASATKLEGLQSVSDYKTLIELVEERIESRGKEVAPLKAESAAAEDAALKVKAANEARITELNGILRELDMKIAAAKEKGEAESAKAKADHDKKVADYLKKCADEVERMRNLSSNAPAQAAEDIRKKNAEVDAEFKEKVKEVHDEIAAIQKTIKAHKDALSEMVRVKNNRQKEEVDCMIPVKEKERDLQRQQAALALAGKCREDGLSENEIIEKQSMWEARDEVDDLEERAFALAYELMALEQGLEKNIGKPKADGETESDSESSDGSDDSSSEASETESERLAREEEERLEREEEERERLEKEAREKYNFEWEHFRDTVKKDVFLSETVETIGKYLAYGTAATVLDAKTGEFSRQFIFLMKRGKGIGITKVPRDGAEPDRRHPIRVIPFENCDGLHLGQHSPLFQHQLRAVGARKTVDRNFIPEDFTKVNLYTFHEYYYRSMSIQHHENLFLDIIFDSASDFEAYIVYIHRHCTVPVGWGKKLNIEMCDRQEDLKPHERELCEELHFLPIDFITLRDKLLLDERRLYLTLHDIRSHSGLDLYHCQRMLEMFLRRRWLVRKQLNYLRFQEEELDEEECTPVPKRAPYVMEAKHAIDELEPIPLQRAADKAELKAAESESSSDDEEGEEGSENEGDDDKETPTEGGGHKDPLDMGAPPPKPPKAKDPLGLEEDDDDLLLDGPKAVPSSILNLDRGGLIDDDDFLLGPSSPPPPPKPSNAGLIDDDEDLAL